MGRMNRRRFLQATGILATGTALAAHDYAPAFAEQHEDASAAVNLSFTTPGGSAPYCKTFDVIAANYHKMHPNITFAKTMCGVGSQSFTQWLLARIAAGNPPDATMYWLSPTTLGVRGAAEPLDDLMRLSATSRVQDWPASALASCQVNNRTYGLPLTAGSYAMWYNADLFAKKGIPSSRDKFPKTWDELRKLSKEFTYWKGDKLVTAGFIPWDLTADSFSVDIFVWSALNGGQVYDTVNQKYTIDSEANIAMMQYFLDWQEEEYKGDYGKIIGSGWAWSSYPDSKNQPPAFQAGNLAGFFQGSWVMGDLYAYAKPGFNMNWNVASNPIGPGGSKTTSGFWPNWLVIPKGSPNKREAFRFLDYMSVTGMKTYFAVTPDLPSNKNFSRDVAPTSVVARRGKTFAVDATQFFFHQLDIATHMWTSPASDFADNQLRSACERIVNKVATPKDALGAAQKSCQAYLDKTLKG
jgi:multiple sugar transport system substrate-binding protein